MDIAVLLYPRMTALDAIGPYEVLSRLPGSTLTFVGAEPGSVRTDNDRLSLVADASIDDFPSPGIVLVPGGPGQVALMDDERILSWARTADETTEWTTSVCTGSLILGAVGLLEGRQATTNWFYSGILENLGATYHQRRWVEDGNLIMSAGVSAGIDMALHLAARLTDEATARRVQRAIDYDPQPPWGGIDYAHIPRFPRALRGAIGLLAPAIAAKPKRLARTGA
jgi:transcriptional regulator GlxA family with amidase domain